MLVWLFSALFRSTSIRHWAADTERNSFREARSITAAPRFFSAPGTELAAGSYGSQRRTAGRFAETTVWTWSSTNYCKCYGYHTSAPSRQRRFHGTNDPRVDECRELFWYGSRHRPDWEISCSRCADALGTFQHPTDFSIAVINRRGSDSGEEYWLEWDTNLVFWRRGRSTWFASRQLVWFTRESDSLLARGRAVCGLGT